MVLHKDCSILLSQSKYNILNLIIMNTKSLLLEDKSSVHNYQTKMPEKQEIDHIYRVRYYHVVRCW